MGLVLEFKRVFTDGTTHVLFEPDDFIARLAALFPRPRAHLVRYHGLLAANAHGCAGAAKHKDVRERPMHASEHRGAAQGREPSGHR